MSTDPINDAVAKIAAILPTDSLIAVAQLSLYIARNTEDKKMAHGLLKDYKTYQNELMVNRYDQWLAMMN